jgi:hypothetical protein
LNAKTCWGLGERCEAREVIEVDIGDGGDGGGGVGGGDGVREVMEVHGGVSVDAGEEGRNWKKVREIR